MTEEIKLADIGAIVRMHAEEQHLSQSELGRRIGVDRHKIWKCYQKMRSFTAEELIRVCIVLGLSVEDFEERKDAG